MVSKQHSLFYGSSYDRGLQYLLFVWPEIKQKYPDTILHVCYGWNTFLQMVGDNPERLEWYRSMVTLLKQPGIVEHGRVSKEELKKIRQQCGIWAYPTDFQEINCITALDCQSDGLVPVVMAVAALQETVGAGVKLGGDIRNEKVQQEYLKELLTMMGDVEKWTKESKKAQKFAKGYDWKTISGEWAKVFSKPSKTPLVSIFTPTIREGWWRIMSENLAAQTYKNFEWLIIDDYKVDRREISEKYAKKYGLNIRYFRGAKTFNGNRKCGLVRANNLAWKNAKGELLVDLQDFVLIPNTGIEQLVDIYNHNPDALIAPVDVMYDCKPANRENKEDWWADEEWADIPGADYAESILTTESWRNVRVQNLGMRESENPFDWEANYGAVPKHILDKLNGWWEFMDDGLGYDNTEVAYRALKMGFRLIIDDSNIAKAVNLWPIIGGTSQNIASRERMLNPPRWIWLQQHTETGTLPVVRDETLDAKISLPFEVPKEVEDKDCSQWITDHTAEIVRGWDHAI